MWSRNLGNILMSPLRPIEIYRVAHDHQTRPAGDQPVARRDARLSVLRLQSVQPRPATGGVFRQSGVRRMDYRADIEWRHCPLWAGRGSPSPGWRCSFSCRFAASTIRCRHCRAGCSRFPGAAAHARVRRLAGAGHRPRIPAGHDDRRSRSTASILPARICCTGIFYGRRGSKVRSCSLANRW